MEKNRCTSLNPRNYAEENQKETTEMVHPAQFGETRYGCEHGS
jgi:hypothetical protein